MTRFYSNNNRKLLAAIHKINKLQGKVNELSDLGIMMEYVIEKRQRNDFHLVSSIDESRCKTLVCRICGDDKFIVGQKEYYTALRCTNCNYDLGIHEG